jgi:hypothetical protein
MKSLLIALATIINLQGFAWAAPTTGDRDLYERAKAEHFSKYSNILIERLATKLSLKKEYVRDALTITSSENGLVLQGHLKVQDSICQLEGKVELLDKSLRAVCFDADLNLRIIL